MQKGQQQGRPPVGIVFDTAVERIDDALAMALLYGFDGKKDVRAVSISVSRSNLNAAIYCDVVGRFYAGAVSGAIGFNGRTLPVGLSSNGKLRADQAFFTAPIAKAQTDIHRFEDTASVGPMIRNALTAQYDLNAIVVLSGPATDLAELLQMSGAKELISRKVKFLVVTGGAYPDGAAEFNIKTDIAAAKKVFAEWPTQIVASGYEVGEKLLFPASSIEKDFAWSPMHPVAEAYRAANPMPYDSPTWAMSAVLYASRPDENYFKLSEPGTITVLDDGRTKFSPAAEGKHRYLILDPARTEQIVKTYTEVASAKPVEKPQRVFTPKKAAAAAEDDPAKKVVVPPPAAQ